MTIDCPFCRQPLMPFGAADGEGSRWYECLVCRKTMLLSAFGAVIRLAAWRDGPSKHE